MFASDMHSFMTHCMSPAHDSTSTEKKVRAMTQSSSIKRVSVIQCFLSPLEAQKNVVISELDAVRTCLEVGAPRAPTTDVN